MGTAPDVLVLGAGPAGLLAAAACSRLGMRTTLAAPDPDQRWTNVYGAWPDEIADPELAEAMSHRWSAVRIRHTCSKVVQREYARVDSAAWQAILRDRCADVGIERYAARAVRHHAGGSVVVDDEGREHAARIVVDATGAGSDLLIRRGEATAFQVAWGELVEADGIAEMRWMDFGDEGTFLYAMPLGDGRAFVEETALVARPAADLDALRERLHRRLAEEGVVVRRTLEVERCRIPMDLPVPDPQRVVGFGAAAGMIHPSTGYLLARLVAEAPNLARALTEADPREASARAWATLWPAPRRHQRRLHRFGADALLTLDPRELRVFFAAFFDLPERTWRAWLADALPPTHLLAAMTSVFRRLPVRLQVRFAGLVPRLLG